MNELAELLIRSMIIDFEGDLDVEAARQCLRKDDSPQARALLSKLIEDKGIDDLLITVADCLKEHLPTGVQGQTVATLLSSYGES